jgi:hypothetical protein
MPRPYPTARMPIGTVIEHDGMTVKKTHNSAREPFPWTTADGAEFGDEWAARAIADGATVTQPSDAVSAADRRHDELVRARAADIIEPHITGNFKRRDRAEGNADDLHRAGLLYGGRPSGTVPVREQAVNILQCRMNWPDAEQISADLAEANLLAEGA